MARKKKTTKTQSIELVHKVVEPRCRICTHSEMPIINQKLIDGRPASEVAEEHSLNYRPLLNHKANHLTPQLREIERARQKHIANEVRVFDDEVLYSPLDKIKLAQETILRELPTCRETSDRSSLLSQWFKSIDMECKILGVYLTLKEVDVDAFHRRMADLIEEHLKQANKGEETGDASENQMPDIRLFLANAPTIAQELCTAFNLIYGIEVTIPSEVIRLLETRYSVKIAQ